MKIALVTGASSDIGTNLIKRIQHKYDLIWAHYNSNDQFLECFDQTERKKIRGVQADFSDLASVRRIVDCIADNNELPDHVIHLAAMPVRNKAFIKWESSDFIRDYTVSVCSVMELLKAFLPKMTLKGYGKVVFMLSSFVEGVSPKYQSPYIVSKYALYGLMKNLSAEYAHKGISINAVSPDMMDTKFNMQIARKIKEVNAENSPLKRNLTTNDVIPTIEFLLSDGADVISGANILVTAGMELM